MSEKSTRLEEIIEATLAEAKKKARMKMKHKEEGEEGEEESSHSKKMEEAKKYHEEEESSYPKKKKMKKMEEAKKHSEEEEEEEEEEEKEEKEGAKKKKMEESTLAASSLKPNSRPKDEPSKPKSASDSDNNKFNATMAQFGPGKDYGVGDKSAHNQGSIDMKTGKGPKTKDPMPKLKEDIDAMFVGEELSEEFKEKASVLFEAAVNARVTAEVSRLQEEYEETVAEQLETFTEEVVNKLDAYLDYAVENWMEENEVAIESTLRNEIMEEFIDGLKNLFAEHYVNVPEEKIEIVEALAEKVEELESDLDQAITENTEMKEIISDVAMREIFEDLSSDLVVTQKEKFLALSEGIEFDGDVEVYEKKLRIIKETYFGNENVNSNLEEETFEGDVGETVSVNPVVNRYVQALTRTVKK